MKKLYFLLLFASQLLTAQVGINTTDPKSALDIRSSNQAAPTNVDGILIPKIDAFPAINPTVAQQGMMVYLTTATTFSGNPKPIGFYYWNQTPADWIAVRGTDGGTLDQAYDFGGAGAGKTITADAGTVLINGTDGLISTGSLGSGAVVPDVGTGFQSRMIWNPRKGAFRAGYSQTGSWNDINIGSISTAFGFTTTASASNSTAFGSNSIASGDTSTAMGSGSSAAGSISTAFGNRNDAIGNYSTAFGRNNTAASAGETVLGIGATLYTPSTNGNTQIGTANATDRLFVIGNAIDANNSNIIDTAERSDAMIVLKNGLTRLPATTNAMITAADGKAVVTKEYLQGNTSGTLDQAYDFGGAGLGKTITADAGAVLINGTDGLVSTGTSGSGAIAPSGAGTRMVWNPRKAAFRAGNVQVDAWDDANIGLHSAAFGSNNRANGTASAAFGFSNTASGQGATAFGVESTASGNYSTTFGFLNSVSGSSATVFGSSSSVSGNSATSFGTSNLASGTNSTTIGQSNVSRSFAEIVLGIGATNYTATTNGESQFRTANAADRLFVVGNAIDADNDNTVDLAERSDALIVLKNGLTRLPSTTNAMITAADGKAVVTKEYLASNTNAWGLSGNSGTNATTNFIGTTDNVDLILRTNNTNKFRIKSNGEIEVGNNGIIHNYENSAGINPKLIIASESAENNVFFQATVNSNDGPSLYFSKARGNNANPQMIQPFDEIARIHFHGFTGNRFASAAMIFSRLDGTASTSSMPGMLQFGTTSEGSLQSDIRMTIRNTGNVGIGTGNPERLLHLNTNGSSTAEGLLYLNQSGTGDALMHFGIANGRHYNMGIDATDDTFKIATSATAMNAVSVGTLITIQPTGEVGIGALTPSERLEVGVGNIAVTGGDIYLGAANGVLNAGGGLMSGIINYIGDAFVAPTQVNGDEDLYIADDLELGGQGYKPGGGLWVAPSDRRLKQNIQPYTDGLESLLRINPVTYKYNSTFKTLDTGETYVGVIAQDVQEIAPYMINEKPFGQLVEEDENGNEKIVNQGTPYLTFDGSALTYMLINAMKEMNVKNELLQQENQALKKSVLEMNQKMELIITEIEKLKK